jgi:hypothetical protein
VSAYDAGAGTATLSGAPTFSGRPWVTSASITRYGLLPFTLSLAQTTNVTTQTQMGALLDAIRSDWEFPAVEWQIETEGGWFFELYDYLELEPNGTHHDTAQFAGVTTVTHTFAGGKLMTTLGLRGKPAGGYRSWLSFGSNAPRAPIVPVLDQFNASWYDPPPPATTAGVLYSGYFGQYCRSVFVEIFEDAAYTTLRVSRSYDDTPFLDTWVLPDQTLDRNKTYYLRATPYSGPLVSGAVSGVAGKPIERQVYAGVQMTPKSTYDADIGTINTTLAGKADVSYVDAKVAGLSWKQAVRAATTAAGTMASSFEAGDTIDGVTLAARATASSSRTRRPRARTASMS